jgi:Flp pilus assembly protein CpaB
MNAPDFTLGSPNRAPRPTAGPNQPSNQPSNQPPNRRAVGRGKSLPSGRAVTGALLIVLSGLGLATAAKRATAEPTTQYVIANRDINPGERLVATDIRVVTMRLAPPVARRSFATKAPLIGAVAIAPLSSGELVQSSAVQAGGPRLREMSFPIDAARALNGDIDPGDRIDIVATLDGQGGKQTDTVLPGMQVISVIGAGSTGGSNSTLVIKVALTDPAQQNVLAQVSNTAQLFVVRANDVATGAPTITGVVAAPVTPKRTAK